MLRRAFLAGGACAGLAACSGDPVWAPDEVVASKSYRGTGPTHLNLFTMKSVRSGTGAHTGLLIDASQRVIFDPAGTFSHPTIPERNDVLFGINPGVEDYYVSYHARVTFFVVSQRIAVPPAVAEQALQLALVSGPVAQANCTRVTSRIIRSLPGFESVRQTWFPEALSESFARLPGVETREFRETDSADKSQATALPAL